jgi:hypothetical protein
MPLDFYSQRAAPVPAQPVVWDTQVGGLKNTSIFPGRPGMSDGCPVRVTSVHSSSMLRLKWTSKSWMSVPSGQATQTDLRPSLLTCARYIDEYDLNGGRRRTSS